MSRREDIMNTVWDDHDELSTLALTTSIWSTTNKRCGMAGAYRCPERHILEGRLGDQLQSVLTELEEAGLVFYREKVLWVPERVEGLHTRTKEIAKAIAKDLMAIKDSEAYSMFFARYPGEQYPWLVDGMSEGTGAVRYALVIESLRNPELHANPAPTSPIGSNKGDSELHAGLRGRGRGNGSGRGVADEAVEVSVDVGEEDNDDLSWIGS